MRNQEEKPAVPAMSKVLFENERVKVIERRIKAGVKTRLHSHPDTVIYSLKDSRVRYSFQNGVETVVDFTAGDAVFRKAETHIAELISPEESLDVMVELK
jgi:uncharacterized RmlC-like cupin family protein